MRIFITGIAGFAGSHLEDLLVKEGTEVFGLVRNKKKCKNLQHLPSTGGNLERDLRLFQGDLLDFDFLLRTLKEIQPDEIYHLAAISNIPHSLNQPDLAFEVNFGGTRKLFDAVLKSGADSRILFVGSSDAYGALRSEDLPIREDSPFRPLSPYALSKATADLLAFQYFKSFGIPIIRARPFNHIGPRQDTAFVCSDFAEQIARIEAGKTEPLLLTGNLKAARDFSDVRDVVRAYRLIMKRGQAGEVFNVCRGKARSIATLLQKLIDLTGLDIAIKQDNKRFRKVDIPVTYGDCSLLTSRTGWRPAISLEESLRDVLNYHRGQMRPGLSSDA